MCYNPRRMLLEGSVERVRFRGEALEDNALRDPVERELIVYLPPSYQRGKRRYPVLFVLTGYASTNQSLLNFKPWEPTLLQRYERLLGQGCREAILVLPDCFTRLGGSQFLDSAGSGRYQSYLADDVVRFVDAQYRTIPKREARAIVGKSSGGFGALSMGMDRPEQFSVIGSHAGDAAFELSIRPRFAEVLPVYERHGGAAAFLSHLREGSTAGAPSGQREFHALELLALATIYAPGDGLPCDPYSAELLPQKWARWLAHDPLVRLEKRPDLLSQARFVFLDAGKFDEYGLQFGARMLAQRLDNSGVTVQHEEFEGGHMGTSHRYDVSLPKLLAALEDDSSAGSRERL